MASFTETATLKVINQSSKEIRAINRDLTKLFKTADNAKKSLKGFGSVKINTGQITLANRSLQGLQRTAVQTQKALQFGGNIKLQPIMTGIKNLKAMQLQAQATARAVAQVGGGANVRPGRMGRGGGGGGGGVVTVQYGGLQSFLNGFTARLGHTIEQSIVSGFQKGVRGVDLANNRQLVLTPQNRAINNANATDIVTRNPQFARHQVLQTMGEVSPAVGNDPANTAVVTEMLLEYSKALMVAGASSEEATGNLQKLSKALGMTSTLLDQEGNFDRKATQDFVNVIVQETITGGAEMTPELIAQLAKYSRTTGKTLNQEGWRTLLMLGEDYGSSAGVGLSQLVKQLTGERIQKKQLASQIDYGIAGSKEVVTGTVGGKQKTEIVSTGVQNEELLRQDPAKWVRDILFPIMKKNGVDVTDNVAVAKFAGEITSDRTATDILTTIITNMGELEQRRKIAEQRGDVNLDEVIGQSLVNQWDIASTQLTSAIGETANSFKTILIPAMTTVSDAARSVAAFISGDGTGNMTAAAALTGGAAVTGLAAYKGAKGLLGGFGLSASAVALDGSAAALTRAAVALGGSPVAGAPGGAGPTRGKLNLGNALLAAGAITIAAAGAVELYSQVTNESKTPYERGALLPGPEDAIKAIYNKVTEWSKEDSKSDQLKDTEAAIAQIKQDIAQAGSDAGAWVIAKQNELANLETFASTLRAENLASAENMRTTFNEGSNTIMTSIASGADDFGANVNSALLGSASQWGAAAGSAFNQTLSQVTANIVTSPAADTGQNANGAR